MRLDRVLYHLPTPEAALGEAVRVLRPGGRIACAHPDHESMVLELPGAPAHLVALTKRGRADFNYESGAVPRQVPWILLGLGLEDVHTEAFTVVAESPDAEPFAIPRWLRDWRDRRFVDVSDEELDEWDAAIDRARSRGGFLFTLTYLLTYGTAPA